MNTSTSSDTSSTPKVIAKLDLGLDRITSVLSLLNNPHYSYPCIHIAGTNGKGSVCSYLDYILRYSNLKVGKFVSPYLCYPSDAITINGIEISSDKWNELLTRIMNINYELTTFELWTIIAFLYFQLEQIDIAIIEVGVGGRGDATNVIPSPVASVITSISNDHIELLGPTLADISRHKAGIIKSRLSFTTNTTTNTTNITKNINFSQQITNIDDYTDEDYIRYGITIISPHMNPIATEVIQNECLEKQSLLIQPLCIELLDKNDSIQIQDIKEKYLSAPNLSSLPFHTRWVRDKHHNIIVPLTLQGSFQLDNCTIALTTIYGLIKQQNRYPYFKQITTETIIQGLSQVKWKGRLEWVTMQANTTNSTLDFLLDGGHNEGALPLVKETIHSILSNPETKKQKPVVYIYGATGSRSLTNLLPLLFEPGDIVYTVPFSTPEGMPWIKSYTAEAISNIITSLFPNNNSNADNKSSSSISIYPCSSLQEAVNKISEHPIYSQSSILRVCCGSLYLVAEAYRTTIK